jgi:predicted O-methyltransferase YrrM
MDLNSEKIQDYALEHTQEEPELLQQLNKETWQKIMVPRMLSGHFQGRILSMISKLIQPKTILEIGTYTGYSALCLAEGMKKNGVLHTIDHNEELVDIQKKYFDKSDYKNNIIRHLGNALEIISEIKENFDLVFIDADKSNYVNYFNALIGKMNPGGVILTDNVLWSGKVVEPVNSKDVDTKTLIEYNELLKNDRRIETILIPIRDGLTISRVK